MGRDRQLAPLPRILLKRKGVGVADLVLTTGATAVADLLFRTGGWGWPQTPYSVLCSRFASIGKWCLKNW